jgi:hypothetical protein
MRTTSLLLVSLALIALAAITPAGAQNTRSWVSATGSDANPCTRAAPCLTFQRAHDQTNAGGVVNCANSGDFSDDAGLLASLLVTKSITLDCKGTSARLHAHLQSGVAVRIMAQGATVTLRHLTIQGGGSGLTGVRLERGSTLHVEHCRISGFVRSAAPVGTAIEFEPEGSPGKLFVSDSTLRDNERYGIVIFRTSRVVLNRVQMFNNTVGLNGNSQPDSGVVSVQMRDSVAAGNTLQGIIAIANEPGSSVVSVTLDRSAALLNEMAGIAAIGSGVPAPPTFVLLGKSAVSSNGTGLLPSGGGNILTYQNNHRAGNVADGAATATLSEQ